MDIETALSDLIDDRDFIEIHKSRARFNLFEAIGGTRAELRHSNFLAFLLSPGRTHGLGSTPLQLLLRALLTNMPPDRRPVRPLEVAIGDLDDAVVYREADNIDILIELHALNLIVVIENKIGAIAGDGQLARYKAVVDAKYPRRLKLFVYLTPEGADSEHPDYVSFSYVELAQVIETLARNGDHTYAPDVVLILNHYVEMLRRNVVEDEGLRILAIKIYDRYSDAIDFIVDCKPQPTGLLPVAKTLVERNSELVQDRHSGTIYRFFPKSWTEISALHQCPTDSWSKTGRNLLFEIKSFKSEGEYSDRVLLSLILGPSQLKLRKFLFDGARANKDVFPKVGNSMGQYWVTLYSRELLSQTAAEAMNDSEKQNTIVANWNDFVNRDLARLSKAIADLASKAPLND